MPKGVYIRTAEAKQNMSNAAKKRPATMLGKKHSDASKKKMSDVQSGTKHRLYGKHQSLETKQRIAETKIGSNNPMFGKKGIDNPRYGIFVSDETRQKSSKSHLGKRLSIETKQKLRLAALQHIEKYGDIHPFIGKNEKQLLDKQERLDGIIILRHCYFHQLGYFVDGYCLENNTVYEVYEKYHSRQIQKDLQRQHEIQRYLDCDFVIIWDR